MTFPEQMWALTRSAPASLDSAQTPTPNRTQLEPGEVLLKITAGGICGSDLPFFLGKDSANVPPLTPGFPLHEITGEVVATQSERFSVGTHVVGWATRQNGLGQYIVTAAHSLHAYSPDLPPETAILLQPLACVLYAAEQIGDVTGKHVAVLGLGPIGVLFAHVLKNRGAARITGVDRISRDDVANKYLIDECVHADAATWADSLPQAEKPEIIVEAIGHQVETFTAAIEAVAYEGKIFYFGIPNDKFYPLPMEMLLRKNLTLQAGVTALPERSRVLRDAELYLREYRELANDYVTHMFAFADAEKAFQSACNPFPGQLKIALTSAHIPHI